MYNRTEKYKISMFRWPQNSISWSTVLKTFSLVIFFPLVAADIIFEVCECIIIIIIEVFYYVVENILNVDSLFFRLIRSSEIKTS